ncbi:hypothetical protein [Aestuariivirga sp.]|uniref:bestrophin-like domain n=1 Tax=Aestuariivirga sp. TaxID=2650926 RepID=UPI003594056A
MVFSVFENPIAYCAALFVGLLLFMELGRRIGQNRLARDPEAANAGTGAVDGVLFALFGLLVAFTFSGAASRFDDRRAMIVDEANDIGTAYLRIDLLPTASQPALRDAFHRYVDSRLAAYQDSSGIESFNEAFGKSKLVQSEIWKLAVAAGQQPDAPPAANMLLLPAINNMIDITSTRATAMLFHPPLPIFAMLIGTALVCSLLAGLAMMRSRSPKWIHMVGFSAIMTVTMYVIADLEYPRIGVIQVSGFDYLLKEAVQ